MTHWRVLIRSKAKLVDPKTKSYTATVKQIRNWEALTGVPFDPFDHWQASTTHVIACPRCSDDLTVRWEDSGKGYSESEFHTTCTACSTVITHDVLNTSKFFRDLQVVVDTSDGIFA